MNQRQHHTLQPAQALVLASAAGATLGLLLDELVEDDNPTFRDFGALVGLFLGISAELKRHY